MWWWWEWRFPSGEWTRWGNSLSIVLHLLLNLPTSISLTQYHAHVHVQSGGFYIIGASPYLVINVAIFCLSVCVYIVYRLSWSMDRHTIFAFGWHDPLPTSVWITPHAHKKLHVALIVHNGIQLRQDRYSWGHRHAVRAAVMGTHEVTQAAAQQLTC